LGGIFNIPSMKSYSIALIAVATSTLVISAGQVFWSQYGLPIFTLPFLLITLSFVYILNILEYKHITRFHVGTPEDNLEYYIVNKNRYVGEHSVLSLPFKGEWYSWQGFDGEWTHKGEYRYAYDFIKVDSTGRSYFEDGVLLNQYYCYLQEVLAPINGRIVRVINQLPDNIIGSTDVLNKWGNQIIIESDTGVIVRIAHLAYDSVFVYEGQTVLVGSVIGLCGNSGNSPQPHIHIQVQDSILPHSITKPFSFVNFAQDKKLRLSGLPSVKNKVTNCHFDLYFDQITNFLLDQIVSFSVYKKDVFVEKIQMVVKMSIYGVYYFETKKGKLYFGKEYGNFYFYKTEGNDEYLRLIFLSLSRMPIANIGDIEWQDSIENSLVLSGSQKFIAGLFNSFSTNKIKTNIIYTLTTQMKLKVLLLTVSLMLKLIPP